MKNRKKNMEIVIGGGKPALELNARHIPSNNMLYTSKVYILYNFIRKLRPQRNCVK